MLCDEVNPSIIFTKKKILGVFVPTIRSVKLVMFTKLKLYRFEKRVNEQWRILDEKNASLILNHNYIEIENLYFRNMNLRRIDACLRTSDTVHVLFCVLR